MNAGIDPFSDEDPMAIYQKILKGKIKFPRNFDKYLLPMGFFLTKYIIYN